MLAGQDQIIEMSALHSRGYSTRAIASRLGFCQMTIRRRLKESGLDLGGPGRKLEITQEYVDIAAQMRADGMEWLAISDKIGFSVRQLQKRLYSK